MQLITSHQDSTSCVHDHHGENRVLSELLGSVMERAGFGLILATADQSIIYAK
jgi:hypothetical protein